MEVCNSSVSQATPDVLHSHKTWHELVKDPERTRYSPDSKALDEQLEWERILQCDKELYWLACDEDRLCPPASEQMRRLCNAVKHSVALRHDKCRRGRCINRTSIDIRVLDGCQMWR